MIKRIWQLAKVGSEYVSMFSMGFAFAFMILWGLGWAVGILLQFVTKTDPVYHDWFRILAVATSVIVSLAVGTILLGIEEEERKREK